MTSEAETAERFLLPANWRLMAAIFGGCLALLIGGYFLFLRQDYAVLYDNVRPADASAIVSELEEQGVSFRLDNGGAQILVPSARLDEVRLLISGANITPTGTEGFELFDQSDMGLSDFDERIKYQRAIQGELARTIMMMDGISEARVHVSMPERSVFRRDQRSAEAAVSIMTATPGAATPALVEGIQRLVAASVAELQASDVVVLDARGEVISPRGAYREFDGSTTSTSVEANPIVVSAMEAVRRALPDVRFDVAIERIAEQRAALTPAAELQGATDAVAADDAVQPAAAPPNAPALFITVTTEAPLTLLQKERVRLALADAGLTDGASGDVLTFRSAPLSPTALERASTTSAAARWPDDFATPAPFATSANLLIALGLALAVIAVAGLLFRRFTRRRLSASEHGQFAERLKALMADAKEGPQNDAA